MPNNLYQQLNSQNQGNMVNNGNGLPNMINKFNEFRNSFQGNPQQMVQQLLQSGRMSQGQFNQLRQMAHEFQNLLNKR